MMIRKRVGKHLRRVLRKRKHNLVDRLLMAFFSLLFPGKVAGFKRSYMRRRIAIVSNSDQLPDLYRQLQWGDYWVKHELIKTFGQMGCMVSDVDPEIVIQLFGTPKRLPKSAYRIAWIYSHPDRVNPEVLKQYDKIFCLSSSFIESIEQMGFEAELMIGATAKRPIKREIEYDIIFIGNARPDLPYGRKIVLDVGETPYNFKVWGARWEDKLPRKYYGGQYFDNQRLNDLYASSLITLNDHHEDMAREGFVAVKIFDILASGGFCISDKNSGIEEIFGDSVPQYESAEHLGELIDFYINHPDERSRLMEKGREIALSHTWAKRAEQFLEGIGGPKLGGEDEGNAKHNKKGNSIL